MDEAQITGGSSSYARKYALSGLLLVDNSDGDPDSKSGDDNQHAKPVLTKEHPNWSKVVTYYKSKKGSAEALLELMKKYAISDICIQDLKEAIK